MSCKSLCPGELTVPVSVEEPTRTPDGHGGFTNDVWTEKVPVIWCKYKESSGREEFAQQSLQVRAGCTFETFYRPDILETDRLKDQDGNVYNIRRVIDVEKKHKTLKILTDYGVPD